MLHAANASSQWYKHILIVANNTDIIVLGWCWEIMGIIWSRQNVKLHSYPSHLQYHVSCLSTCSPSISCPDRLWQNILFLSSIGKESAYKKWETRPALTTTLCHLMESPPTLSSEDIIVIDSFAVSLHVLSELHFDKIQPSMPENICSVVLDIWIPSTNQGSSDRTQKEQLIKLDMCGANLSLLNKSCQDQANGGGLSLSLVECLSGLPSVEQQNHCKSLSSMDAKNGVQESACAKRRGLFVQLGAIVEDCVTGSLVVFEHQLPNKQSVLYLVKLVTH